MAWYNDPKEIAKNVAAGAVAGPLGVLAVNAPVAPGRELQKQFDSMTGKTAAENQANQLKAQGATQVVPLQTAAENANAALAARKAAPTQFAQVAAPGATAASALTPGAPTTAAAQGATIGTTAKVDPTFIAALQSAQAQQIAPVANVNAAQLAAPAQANVAQVAPVERVASANLQTDQQNQLRAQQVALANSLQAQASGQTPSLAEMQLKQANDKAIAQQQAIAGAARGGNVALAQRNAALNTAALQQQNAVAAGQARLQQQQVAQQQLADVLGGARTTDVGLAQTQAQLTQQAALANQQAGNVAIGQQAGLTQETGLANVAAKNQAASQQAQLTQQAGLANQATQAQLAGQQAQMGTAVNLANTQQQNAAIVQQAQMNQQAQLANQAAINDAQAKQAELTQTAALQNRQMTSAEQQTYAKLQGDINVSNAQLANAVGIANQDQAVKAQMANQAAQLQAQGMDDAQIAKLMGLNIEALGAVLGGQTSQAKTAAETLAAQNANQGQMLGSGIGAIGAIGAAMLSDVNQKTDIKPIGSTDDDEDAKRRKAKLASALAELSKKPIKNESEGILSAGSSIAAALAKPAAEEVASDKGMKKDLYSDKNAKQDKGSTGNKIGQFLDALQAYEYKYKDTTKPGTAEGQRYGILAQDLAKSEVGSSIVDKKDGMLMVNVPQGLGVALAAMADLNKRLKKMEDK